MAIGIIFWGYNDRRVVLAGSVSYPKMEGEFRHGKGQLVPRLGLVGLGRNPRWSLVVFSFRLGSTPPR